MAVGDEDVAVGGDGDVGRPVEGVRSLRADARGAERHEQLAVAAELEDLVSLAVGAGLVARPHVPVVRDVEPVRPHEHAVAERLDQVAVGIEPQDGGLRPMERPHVLAVRIGVDGDDVAPGDVRGELGPALDVGVVGGPELQVALGADGGAQPGDQDDEQGGGPGAHRTPRGALFSGRSS